MAEVVSPTDRYEDAIDTAEEYLRAGVRLVWVIGPRSQSIQVFTSNGGLRTLGPSDTLDGGDVLPGFAVPVKALFPPASDAPAGKGNA